MKKGGFLRNVLDTIRSNQANQSAGGAQSGQQGNGREFGGLLKPQHFSLAQVARHGFPEQPTALAFDPVQKIAAIGTKTGALRVFGRPGVDVWAQHKPECAVTHIKFVINQGAIITVTADESVHLWSLRGPNLKLQHSQNTSPSTSSSPAQASQSPAPPSQQQQQQQQTGATSSSSSNTAATASAAAINQDSQPGDPDYLADTLSSSSPTYDKSKQYPRQPEILHTLRFQREHITCLHQTLMSKWLYIGTERGNVHVANVETFELSGYSIAWNKAIELCRKTHPGSIIHISECPQDSNKLLIGYESGCIVLWDLKGRNAEGRYYHAENLLWLSWHYEGKQFVAAHGDGSLVTWQTRSNARPANILYPHAKTPTQSGGGGGGGNGNEPGDLLNFQQQSSSFMARALSNELYRPINKVDWKTSRNNEQFLLFSGGLPYDGLEGFPSTAASVTMQQQQQQNLRAASVQPPPSSGQQSAQQYLKASSASHNPSPISPSISPATNSQATGNNDPATNKTAQRQSQQQQQAPLKERKSLRSTSLTVMYGKSITVLEMDDTIIDFITICDNSPYENDTSDPQAVIILLSNDLILIDLTSSGYPSFDSPYPSANLNESPVTCLQYLADCSSDLIPFLYSTSQNAVSRVPKKGFSDKEWPINGGEWGQQMQSYPELVITGHADGSIKFWDMSGVNFDLISKIKTSKFFERPNKMRNSTSITHSQALSRNAKCRALMGGNSASGASTAIDQSMATLNMSSERDIADIASSGGGGAETITPLDESPFAIEKIEYYPNSKHLVVAGALSQVIQFRINKKESGGYPISSSSTSQSTAAAQETATMLVDPPTHSDSINQVQQQRHQKHLVLKARNLLSAGSSSSSGGSSSSSSGSNRARSTGFHAELICLTPSILVPLTSYDPSSSDPNAAAGSSSVAPSAQQQQQSSSYYCVAPPKITALALQAAHNILAYAHENGIVLVDIIQKCVIISASLNDLYGGAASMMQGNRDINIQPFATSSILQHHYQSTLGSPGDFVGYTSTNAGINNNGPAAVDSKSAATACADQLQQRTTKTRTTDNENSISDNNGPFQPKSASSGRSNESATAAGVGATNQPTATTAAAGTDEYNDDHGRNVDDNKQRGQESEPATRDHVDELNRSSSAAAEPEREQQQHHLSKGESRTESCTVTSSSSAAAVVVGKISAEVSNECSGAAAALSQRPRPRARLVQAKSVSCAGSEAIDADVISAQGTDRQPVAPPRARKRQSVPFARVPGDLVARHNAALAEMIAVAEEATQIEEKQEELLTAAAAAASAGRPSAHPVNHSLSSGSSGLAKHETDNKRAADAEIDNRCSPEVVAAAAAPISSSSSKPQAAASTVHPVATAAPDHRSAPSAGSVVSSIFTKLMAFQRQLSTTALLSEQQTGSGKGATPSSGGHTPRLFQRQMTASQLFNHSSPQQPNSSAAQTSEALTNKQRAAALLASARANNSELASSTSCLSSSPTTTTTTSSSGFMSRPSSGAPGSGAGDGQTRKSGGGKKRIISRMLSISAIHTNPSLSSNSNQSSGEQMSSPNASTAASAAAAAAAASTTTTTTTGGANYPSATTGGHNGIAATSATNDQVPDKIDSSFTRSRSSSTSSSALQQQQQQQQLLNAEHLGERVQCLCFLDWSRAMASAAAGVPSSSGAGAGAGATAANNNGTASSPPNNKSLGSPPIADQANGAPTNGQLALYLGTSHGCVLLVHLQMPDNEDNRVLQLQSVNAEPIPQASIKLPGAILCLAPFTSELQTVAPPGGAAAATNTGGHNSPAGPQSVSSMSMDLGDSPTAGGGSSSGGSSGTPGAAISSGIGTSSSSNVQQPSSCSPQTSFDSRSSLFLAIVSEKQAKVYQIPSQQKAANQHQQARNASSQQQQQQQLKHHPAAGAGAAAIAESPLGKLLTNKANCLSKMDICDSSYSCRSQLVQMRSPDETCLVSYLATGSIIVHSLPQLRQLHEADFVPYSSQRIAASMLFSRNGHCLYQPSRGEISKFTLSGQYRSLVNEMTGLLYVQRDMPEMPRANFFKSLFTSVASSSAASKQSDRDELFGEKSTSSRGVAKHFSTSGQQQQQQQQQAQSGLDKLRGAAVGTMGHDLRIAREGLDERGEKLGEIEDRTAQMMNQSESYAQAAHQLAQKFKDKKWYQF